MVVSARSASQDKRDRFQRKCRSQSFPVLVIIITIVAVTGVSARRIGKERRIVRLNEFKNCPDRPFRPWHFTNRKITAVENVAYYFTADGVCNSATQTIERVTANFTKCSDRTRRTCEHSHRLEWNSGTVICPLFLPELTPWWSILKSFSPHLNCANRKGNFTVRNMTIGYDAISDMQFVGNEYWISQWEFYDETLSPWACIHGETDFPVVRKDRKGN